MQTDQNLTVRITTIGEVRSAAADGPNARRNAALVALSPIDCGKKGAHTSLASEATKGLGGTFLEVSTGGRTCINPTLPAPFAGQVNPGCSGE